MCVFFLLFLVLFLVNNHAKLFEVVPLVVTESIPLFPLFRAENYNTSAVEFLRRLPGVTDSNYRALMDGCKSLSELALLPVERLSELMGGQKAAKTLRDFLDAKCPSML